jgi:hypothetical protein
VTWGERASNRFSEAGFKAGAARRRVIELLDGESCALTALEIDRRLPSVGRATVLAPLLGDRRLPGGDLRPPGRREPDRRYSSVLQPFRSF